MICLICRQAEIVEGFTPIHFERGEMHLLIKHVPARVCQQCGEVWLEAEVGQLIERVIQQNPRPKRYHQVPVFSLTEFSV